MKIRTIISNKNLSGIILSLLPFFLSTGCQKVINVDLNESAPKIVIEGIINDRRGPYSVTITRSGSYFNQPVLPTVSGATVIITDNSNNIDTLKEEVAGVYLTSRIRGIPERTYTLKVMSDGQEYDAASTMARHVNLDSIKLFKSDIQWYNFGENNNSKIHAEIHCFFVDPMDKNFYRVRVFRNDSINNQSYRLFDDQYTNGQMTELRVSNAVAGNSYRIELLSIDRQTYSYYRTLDDLLYTNPFFGSTPANPDTNLSNGALGYFGTAAVSSRTIVVTEAMMKAVQ